MKAFLLCIFLMINNLAFTQHTSSFTQLDSLLHATYNDSLPGASVAVIENGKPVFKKSYGISNLETKEKITATSNFNICSLTKQFTALAILQLEEKRLLSLNDHISKFFPDMNKKIATVVTVKELLTHSSGIVDHYDHVNTTNLKHAHNIDVYNAIKNLDSTYFTPGTKFRYSNSAFCLLALIIEKLSGKTYNDYMLQNIFKPAGMSHTLIWNEHATITNEVTGYSKDSSGAFIKSGADEHIFFSTEGDGGVYTSVDDYTKWFNALHSGKVFSKNIVAEARSLHFVIDSANRTGYGFGWFVSERDATKKVYHSGSNGGFRTYSFTIPASNFLLVIFSNRDDIEIEKMVQQMISVLFPRSKSFIPIEVLTS